MLIERLDSSGNKKVFVDDVKKRVIIRSPDNYFLGTVDNLWSNPANWSLGFLPTAGHNAIIQADCAGWTVALNPTVKNLIIEEGVSVNVSNGGGITVTTSIVNYGSIIKVIGNASALMLPYNPNNVYGNIDYRYGVVNLSSRGYSLDTNMLSNIINSDLAFSGDWILRNSVIQNNTKNISITGTIRIPEVVNVNSISGNTSTSLILSNSAKLVVGSLNLGHNAVAIISSDSSECEVIINSSATFGNGINIPDNILLTINASFTLNSVYINLFYTVRRMLIKADKTLTIGTKGMFYEVVGESNSILANSDTITYMGVTNDKLNVNLQHNANSVFGYGLSGNQEIKPSSYKELRLQGSGVKKLTGDAECEHLYFGGTATLDENGYSLTGYTSYTDIRTNAQNIPTTSFANLSLGNSTKTLTGNTVVTNFYQLAALTLATGSYTLTATNVYNQINNNSSLTPSQIIHTNWYYSLAGAQAVMGGTYTNLTLSGSGIKTLRDNVIVTGTYSRIGTATLDKNGFTIKDSLGNDLE